MAGLDGKGFVGRPAVDRYVPQSGTATGLIEIIDPHIDLVGLGNGQGANEGLVHVAAGGLYVHNRTGRNVIGFRLVERDGCGASQRASVEVPARMVLSRGHGMGDVAGHARNGSDGIQDPAVASVFGNVDGGIATARNGIGSEWRSANDLWVGSLDSEK